MRSGAGLTSVNDDNKRAKCFCRKKVQCPLREVLIGLKVERSMRRETSAKGTIEQAMKTCSFDGKRV